MDFERLLKGKKYKKDKNMREYWNYRSLGFNKMAERNKVTDDSFLGKIIKEKNVLNKDSTVLDVGCGVGRHLLYFADKSKKVTGIDISDKMLEYAKQNLEKSGYKNFQLYNMDWEEENSSLGDEKFDLVFASMSAALSSKKAIEKFDSYSRKYGIVERFLKEEDSFKVEIGKLLKKDTTHIPHNNSEYTRGFFNILFDMGYFPEVFVDRYTEKKKIKTENIKEEYNRFFKKFDDIELRKIDEYLKDKDEIEIKTEKIKAIIFWDKDIKK